MTDLLNHPLIAERYFFRGGRGPASRLDVAVDGATLACGIHRVDATGHTVVFFHGNGEVVADWQGVLDIFLNGVGWDALLAEYRGYGGSTGEPTLGRMLDDVPAIIEATGPPEKVVVMGRSVGSFFALEAVRRFPSIAGLILDSGIGDALERIMLRVSPAELGGTPDQWAALRERLDHRDKIGAYQGPVLLLHTRHDGLVDVSHAEQLAEWAGGETNLTVFERGNHNTILAANTQAYLAEVATFLTRVGSAETLGRVP